MLEKVQAVVCGVRKPGQFVSLEVEIRESIAIKEIGHG